MWLTFNKLYIFNIYNLVSFDTCIYLCNGHHPINIENISIHHFWMFPQAPLSLYTLWYSTVWMHHNLFYLFTCWSIFVCFPFGNITNKVAVNICLQVCVWTCVLFSLGRKHFRVEWLDHMADIWLTFEEMAKLFQRGCTILHSYLQYLRVSVIPYPC